jgi:hypothetical protein
MIYGINGYDTKNRQNDSSCHGAGYGCGFAKYGFYAGLMPTQINITAGLETCLQRAGN